MRRWLIAIFTLHFFVSVGLFTFGAFSADMAHDVAALSQEAQAATPKSPFLDRLDTTPDHGLTDAQPDLPEVIPEPFALLQAEQVLVGPRPPTPWKRVEPTLAGLQRPPKAHLVS